MSDKTKQILLNGYRQIIRSVQASSLYKKNLHLFDGALYYKNTLIDIEPRSRLILAGSGKAALSMGEAFLDYLPRKIDDSLFICPSEPRHSIFNVIPGNHPIPGEQSLIAGKCMYHFISSLSEHDTLFYFLSGGSSALFELPEDDISLKDISALTHTLLSCGATIHEINILRSTLSKVKAGKLGRICKSNCYVFVLSDVMGNDLSTIGSGPFYSSGDLSANIQRILQRYQLEKRLETKIINNIRNISDEKTLTSIPHYLIGSNMDLLEAAELICFDEGIKPITFPESLTGEAKEAGKMIATMVKNYKGSRPACLIFGGETTVTLNGNPGLGGRSQELALSALNELKDTSGITILSAGSDGIDGVGGAAGAIISPDSNRKAKEKGLSCKDYLERHDSYHFFKECDALIECGYTGTNVGDIVMALMVDEW
jgi:hydroxypyruvate reductase/glycerate 2-kinase